jgi:hypothetical protein
VQSGVDQFGGFGGRQLDIPEQQHRGRFRTSLRQEAVQVSIERDTHTVFQECMRQNPIVGRRPQAGLANVNYVESRSAEQEREVDRKILVKKQPKH